MPTPEHFQDITIHIHEYYPAHEPRETDPHYHLFNEARRKLKAAGKLTCWVCGKDEAAAGQPIELHHSVVEFALANGVDISKFSHLYPEFNVHDEEAFFAFVESEGNLLALCKLHHTGREGIHCLPQPIWRSIAVWKDALPPPGEIVSK